MMDMGIWGSLFGWKTLFRWDVLGVIVPGIFLAVGVGMLGVDWFPHNLLIAQTSFTFATLLILIKIVGHAIESEGSLRSRGAFAFFMSLLVLALWFFMLRIIQQHKANSSNFSHLNEFLRQQWVRHVSWMLLGILIFVLCNGAVFAVSSLRSRAKQGELFEKGFLDFKLQAETAIDDIGPAITPISSITSQVGNFMEKHAREVSVSVGKSTKDHLRVTRAGSVKLDRYSRRLESKCLRLERIGSSLHEGLLGWYRWANQQESSRVALSEATPSLRGLCQSVALAIKGADGYISILRDMKGVSRDMNGALERHIKVMVRIRNANSNILSAGEEALMIADSMPPRGLPSAVTEHEATA